ncbi:hypothetical protein [Glaciecola sp. SC05]|uniref:hypothetical protein n=1 Tax=Glaciecola sp. SC05 TaxID=1987355 RepID=UPI0035278EE9
MGAIRVILTAIFSIFSAIGLVSVILSKAPLGSLIICLAYVFTAMALNRKGGIFIRYIGYITSFILSIGIIGAIYAAILPLLGSTFEPLLFGSSLVIGVIGVTTFFLLKKRASDVEV